jgi:hypothetical protein
MSVLWTQMHQTLKCLLMAALRMALLSDGKRYAVQVAGEHQVVLQLHHVIQVHIVTRMDVKMQLTSCDRNIPPLSGIFIDFNSG